MLADILDSLDTSQLVSQLDKFREKLEALNLSQSDYLSTSEKLTKIAHLLNLAQSEDDLLTKARKFEDLSQLAFGLVNEYQQILSPAFYEVIESFAETSKGYGKIYRGLHILMEGRDRENLAAKLENFAVELDSSSQPKVTQSSSLLPFLTHLGRDESEQLQKNQPAMALLKLWLEERVDKQNVQSEKEAVESLKRAMDENRLIGYKLFD